MKHYKMQNKPVGRLDVPSMFAFHELWKEGCIQTGADVHPEDLQAASDKYLVVFHGLFNLTKGNLCDGCSAWDGGRCRGYKKYHTGAQMPKAPSKQIKPEVTVKQWAERLGISKNEVRRRKFAGTLPKE